MAAREWRELANSMGLGREPDRAFEALSPAPIPDDLITTDRMRRDLGDNIVAHADWASVAITMRNIEEYFIDPPTRYEVPLSYSTLAYELDVAVEALTAAHQTLPYRPLVASLPSGDVNAKIRNIPKSDEVVVLFQHGIIEFLDQLAITMGAAMPVELLDLPLRAEIPGESEPGDRTHRQLAVEQLTDSLTSYVVGGNPYHARRRILKNRALASGVSLAAGMRKFLMSHELMHLLLMAFPGFKCRSAARPGLAARVRCERGRCVALRTYTPGTHLNMWACDVALWAFEMLERTVAYLEAGTLTGLPPTHSHPTPHARRCRLLEEKTRELLDQGEADMSGQLSELTGSGRELGEQLWEATMPYWDGLRKRGVRPGALWKKRLEQAYPEEKS